MDGVSDCGEITKLFADKYEDLYTCVSYDEADNYDGIKVRNKWNG